MRPAFAALILLSLIFEISVARADDKLLLGPVPTVLSFRNIDFEGNAMARVVVDSEGNALNVVGAVDIAVAPDRVSDSLAKLAKSLLPFTFQKDACKITVLKVEQIKLSSKEHEARLAGKLFLSAQGCSMPGEVSFEIPFIPVRVDKSTLRLSIPRDPTIHVPGFLGVLARVVVGDLNKLARKNVQEFLVTSDLAKLTIPPIEGIQAAFQGANFNTDRGLLIFHIVGDGHFTWAGLQAILEKSTGAPELRLNLDRLVSAAASR